MKNLKTLKRLVVRPTPEGGDPDDLVFDEIEVALADLAKELEDLKESIAG